MLRSPISAASFCTFARSSSRKATSSGDSSPALETFFPGILIPNHQSNTKTAATTMVTRSARERIFRSTSRSMNTKLTKACSRDFWGAHAARVYCMAARRTALWETRHLLDFLLKNRTSHACEFSASGRKQHAGGVRSPDSHRSRELFAETQSAQTKKKIRHHNKH